jgi:hypothetical protein
MQLLVSLQIRWHLFTAAANNENTLHFQKLMVHVMQLVKGVGKSEQRAPQVKCCALAA